MTGQDLLDRMEILNAELQLQSGEEDATRGSLALNIAQDYFESLAASRAKLFWGSSTGTVATVASTETSSWPTGLLRLDRLQLLDSNGKIKQDLKSLQRTGGHVFSGTWPTALSNGQTGSPARYWHTGTSIYWDPLPDGIYTVRWYGLAAAADISSEDTFSYPDIVALPLAAFAVNLLKVGVDDDPGALQALAGSTFESTLQTLEMTNRDGPKGFFYTEVHTS